MVDAIERKREQVEQHRNASGARMLMQDGPGPGITGGNHVSGETSTDICGPPEISSLAWEPDDGPLMGFRVRMNQQ